VEPRKEELAPSPPLKGAARAKERQRRQRQHQRQAQQAAAIAAVRRGDPDVDPADTMRALDARRRAVAYCTAQEYDMEELLKHLTRRNRTPSLLSEDSIYVDMEGKAGNRVEVFYMQFGAVVIWGSEGSEEDESLLADVKAFEREPVKQEDEDMPYVETGEPSKLGLHNGMLSLLESAAVFPEDSSIADDVNAYRRKDKLTASYVLGKSAKLSVIEGRVDDLLDRTKPIPEELALSGKTGLTSAQINRQIGNLLSVRAYLNLHSDLLDAPDIVWDNAKLEALYLRMAKHLDIDQRAERINRRLDYSKELFDLLRQTAAEKHSSSLEKIIIYLISVEIVFNIFPIGKMVSKLLAPLLGL
jgi:uncharacterized Rmd1/YagE family protein